MDSNDPKLVEFVHWLVEESDWDVVEIDTYAYLANDAVKDRAESDQILKAYEERPHNRVSEATKERVIGELQSIVTEVSDGPQR